MPQTTPFHQQLKPLNQPQIWKDWSGYLVAPKYQHSEVAEYYAIRNSVGVFDTSPLFKYRISGSDSEAFFGRLFIRDIRKCKVGQAQYTCWCNENGFVNQDGVVMHVRQNEYWLTAGEPALRELRQFAAEFGFSDIRIEDLSKKYGILAVQGPHSLNALKKMLSCDNEGKGKSTLLTKSLSSLDYFDAMSANYADRELIVSRTGFTGDLGYELWVESDLADEVWLSLMTAGEEYNIMPIGTRALKMARVEAGLLLLGVDFDSARFAWVDAQRETPCELGWQWMLRGLNKDDRNFVGRCAIEKELAEVTSRWKTVGLAIDWHEYEKAFVESGVKPPKQGVYEETTKSIYRRNDKDWDYAGYASSFLYSSLLRKPIAIAKLPLDLARVGAEVDLEISVIRKPKNVLARVVEMPFFDPSRRKAKQ